MPIEFFCRQAKLVAPDLIGCALIKRQANQTLLCGMIVETEAYSQEEPGCHGFHKKTPRNKTLFGEPGNFYIYLTYGVNHCVNVVTDRKGFASGVLLRALTIPGEDERIASGPGLLARRYDLTRCDDNCPSSVENGLWLARSSKQKSMLKVIQTTRIGISKAKELPWRWYLQSSRSVSKRKKGDKCPPLEKESNPLIREYQ